MAGSVLVTGGTRGIGRAIVETLAPAHRVVALWHSTTPDALPEGVDTIQANLATPEGCAAAVDALPKGPISGIVNNAGLITASPIDGFDATEAAKMLAVNNLAPALLLAAALPRMERGASVVNISSVNADLPPMGAALYGASKAALSTWTRGAAKELGPRGIRVNAVHPARSTPPRHPVRKN